MPWLHSYTHFNSDAKPHAYIFSNSHADGYTVSNAVIIFELLV
jgi:hypothetical protein